MLQDQVVCDTDALNEEDLDEVGIYYSFPQPLPQEAYILDQFIASHELPQAIRLM